MKKRFLTLLIVLVLLFSLPVCAGAAKEEFSGSRTVTFTADWSDLTNFVNGGRPVFDLILRSKLPEWASYKLRTQGRDITLTLSFPFGNLSDYENKVSALTLRIPALIFSQENGLLLVENSTSFDLLNFLEMELDAQESLSEKKLDQIFTLSASSITINSDIYELVDGVCIHPDGAEIALIDSLAIETATTSDNAFIRTITATIDLSKGSSNDVEDLEMQFNQVGEARVKRNSGNERTVSISFEALSQADLERKTMLCLNVPTFITEQQVYVDNRTISVERTEFFDLAQLLREEGSFSYSFNLPSYCTNLSVLDDNSQVSGSYITSENASFVTCTYERSLQFSAVEIRTDMSNLLGKIERTIVCTIPVTIAEKSHKTVKDKLQLHLCNGSVLNIYDQAGMRYYEITFSSWRAKDVEKFTASVLNNSDYTVEIQSSWIPFGKSTITDNYDAENLIARIVPADRMTATYILSNLSIFDKSMFDVANAEILDSTIVINIRSGSDIRVVYRQIQILKCTAVILTLVVALILVLWVIRRFQLIIARLRGKESVEKPSVSKNKYQSQPSVCFCPYCGKRNTTNYRFCNYCGNCLDDFESPI